MEYAFCQYNYTSPLYFVVFLCTKNSQNYKILILFEIIFYFCLSLDTLRRPGPCRHSQGNPPHPPHPRGRPVTENMDTVGTILLLPPGPGQTPRLVTFHHLGFDGTPFPRSTYIAASSRLLPFAIKGRYFLVCLAWAINRW